MGRLGTLGAMGWPFRDIKVEEFIDGDHLVIRAELPGVDPDRDIEVSAVGAIQGQRCGGHLVRSAG
jgi:HSP20 family molecular chaperone IbpA